MIEKINDALRINLQEKETHKPYDPKNAVDHGKRKRVEHTA